MATMAGNEWTDSGAESDAEDLQEVRRRRAELLESITALEQALAAPGRQTRWAERVSAALLELSGDFRDHVALNEGPAGLNIRVIRSSPRLAHAVDRLTQDHVILTGLIEELISLVGQVERSSERSDPTLGDPTLGDPTLGDPTLGDADEVRERGNALLTALVRHRQRGADLVYEAYTVDIGGQD